MQGRRKSIEPWDRDVFRIAHTNRKPFAREVFLGNGRLGAMFDHDSFATRDYIYHKGIRRDNALAGLFWTYFDLAYSGGPANDDQVWDWEQCLDMYDGILQTEFRRQGKSTTFVHVKENMVVFDFERHPVLHDDPILGITTARRGGKYADIIKRKIKLLDKKTAVIDLKVKGSCIGFDKREIPNMYCGDVFRDVNWSVQIAVGISGEGYLSSDLDGMEFCLTGKKCTVFVCIDAKTKGTPDAVSVLRKTLRKGYKKVRHEHTASWHEFWNRCRVDVPDSELLRLYISSLYLIKANCEKKGFYSTFPGPIGSCVQSVYGWDDIGHHEAFLSTNHPEEAESIVNFWDSCRQLGAKVQKSISPKSRGISLAHISFDPMYYKSAPRLDRDHFHIFPGIEACRQFEYTKDRKYLKRYFLLIKGIADMLETYALIPAEGGLEVRPCQPVDESYGFAAIRNPMMGAAMAKSFLKSASKLAGLLGRSNLAEKWSVLSDRIILPEDSEYYLNNASMTKRELKTRISGETMIIFFPAMLVPDRAKAERTYKLYAEKSLSTMGLGIINGANYHHWVGSFPSCHFLHACLPAAMLERRGDMPEMLEAAKRMSLEWGTFPECIRSDDRGLIMTPEYLFPSAGYILTVNAMFLQGVDGQIKIFPAVPGQWLKNPLSFKLRCMPGALIEVVYKPDEHVMYVKARITEKADVLIRLKDSVKTLKYKGKSLDKTGCYFKLSLPCGLHELNFKWK